MQNQIILKPKNKLLDGVMVPVDIQLGTTRPVVVPLIHFNMPARVVICDDYQLQQKMLNTNYQMTHPVPDGVQLEVASNVYWNKFDLNKPCPYPDQRKYFIHPQEWKPAVLQSKTGKLYGVIEARCGNDKHKAGIEIVLHVYEETKSAR